MSRTVSTTKLLLRVRNTLLKRGFPLGSPGKTGFFVAAAPNGDQIVLGHFIAEIAHQSNDLPRINEQALQLYCKTLMQAHFVCAIREHELYVSLH